MTANREICNRQRLEAISLIALFVLCLALPSPSTADIYRYMDQEGVIHLTNMRPDQEFMVCLKEGESRDDKFTFKLGQNFDRYDSVIALIAAKYGVDCALVKAVIKAESNFNHKAVSKKGAKGLMQLMPQIASSLGVDNCFHPEDNINGGIRYLKYLIDSYSGDLSLALAAYNAGEGAVARHGGIPPYTQTRTYVQRVLANYDYYKKESGTKAAPVY